MDWANRYERDVQDVLALESEVAEAIASITAEDRERLRQRRPAKPLSPIDSLDHSSRLPNFGSKMGIDATRKWPQEGFTRPWPDEMRMSAAVKQRVDALSKQAGLNL